MAGGAGVLSAGGQFFGMAGEAISDNAEAAAYDLNSRWLFEQADFARRSTKRELKIQGEESREFYGEKESQYAKGGVDMSGSPIILLAQTKMRAYEEKLAIIDQGEMQYKEASLKGQIAKTNASATRAAGSMKQIAGTLGAFGSAAKGAYEAGKK